MYAASHQPASLHNARDRKTMNLALYLQISFLQLIHRMVGGSCRNSHKRQ